MSFPGFTSLTLVSGGGGREEEFEKRLERMEIKRKSILGSDFRVR